MQSLTVKQIRERFPKSPSLHYGDDFLLIEISYPASAGLFDIYPCKFKGATCIYCLEGEFNLSVGLEEYDFHKDCFAVSVPGDIVTFSQKEGQKRCRIRILAISDELLKEMEFDISKANVLFRYRMVKANLQYQILIHNFRNLFRSTILSPHDETKESLAYLLRSMYIELTHIWESLASAPRQSFPKYKLTELFVSLVAKHHVTHRDVAFYASQLGVTPKYLSVAVKKASGRTAVEWITSYVILESKFYLRHTNSHIKEIAYALQFQNQMDFYRYFTRHTGMSPSEYRERNQ